MYPINPPPHTHKKKQPWCGDWIPDPDGSMRVSIRGVWERSWRLKRLQRGLAIPPPTSCLPCWGRSSGVLKLEKDLGLDRGGGGWTPPTRPITFLLNTSLIWKSKSGMRGSGAKKKRTAIPHPRAVPWSPFWAGSRFSKHLLLNYKNTHLCIVEELGDFLLGCWKRQIAHKQGVRGAVRKGFVSTAGKRTSLISCRKRWEREGMAAWAKTGSKWWANFFGLQKENNWMFGFREKKIAIV